MFNWPIESIPVSVAAPVTTRMTPRQVGFSSLLRHASYTPWLLLRRHGQFDEQGLQGISSPPSTEAGKSRSPEPLDLTHDNGIEAFPSRLRSRTVPALTAY